MQSVLLLSVLFLSYCQFFVIHAIFYPQFSELFDCHRLNHNIASVTTQSVSSATNSIETQTFGEFQGRAVSFIWKI